MAEKTPSTATSLVKALQVLLALEEKPAGRGVTDIARALGLPKSAVHRLLVTFQAHGFVQKLPQEAHYALGPTLVRLGLRAADMYTPQRIARPHLEALAHKVGETVFLGMLSQDQVLVVDKMEPAQGLRVSPPLGALLPLRQTALGKLLLAFSPAAQQTALLDGSLASENDLVRARWRTRAQQELASIRQQGFAVGCEEWEPDICCLAVPLRNSRGTVVAALALALPRHRMPAPQRHDPFAMGDPARQYPTLVPPLLAAAADIVAVLP
jgi:IclR family transcriptional regulator, KDG regulon repressor